MNFITNLLTLQNQMRVFHWQTQHKVGSFAQHNAFGTAYEDLDAHIDDFIEIYQGKKGAIMASGGTFNLTLHNLSENAEDFVDEYITYLVEYVPQGLEEATLCKECSLYMSFVRGEVVCTYLVSRG